MCASTLLAVRRQELMLLKKTHQEQKEKLSTGKFPRKLTSGKNRIKESSLSHFIILILKKRRGGHRLRKMKERYVVTGMRKLDNRIACGANTSSLTSILAFTPMQGIELCNHQDLRLDRGTQST
ncbi:putative U4PU6 small nuclear ribonucleoprotein Prp31 [Cardamine amara subsp. amara]|uniref:U4PU6 small nuclear ribonucleoprotein Prp31 n=1 Tax=Cardamine amara subsp. amara TaxID=228776 RepID=A0ABD1BIR8_CARAN